MLSDEWWFWALAALTGAILLALGGRYRHLAHGVRRSAVRRGLVSLPPGQELRPLAGGPLGDLSWLAYPAAAWTIAAPWIWGYDGSDDAIVTDVVTGAVVIAVALAAVVWPALWALDALAGLW